MTTSRPERALDILNVALADVRYGLGPYLAIYLLVDHGWNELTIATAFLTGSITGLICQTPIGMMVDAIRAKRALLAASIVVVVASCVVIVQVPRFPVVAVSAVVGMLAGVIMGTTLAAISLGMVGPAGFARRAARNEALFHAGNVVINLVVLAVSPFFGISVVVWGLVVAGIGSITALLAIPAQSVDHAVARGFSRDAVASDRKALNWRALLSNRGLLVFAGCGALFHLANASMLGLLVQRQALSDPSHGFSLAAAYMIAAQLAMVGTAAVVGAKADSWDRKRIFFAAFLILALRGTLYTASDDPFWTIGVQVLDGVGVGIFGALVPVVVADLTRGSGHFNAAQGAVGTVHSIGGITSGVLGNFVVVWIGYDAAFLTQAAIAAAGGLLFWCLMPEIRTGTADRSVSCTTLHRTDNPHHPDPASEVRNAS
jgi:Na+/melibiose symporter-like transporter